MTKKVFWISICFFWHFPISFVAGNKRKNIPPYPQKLCHFRNIGGEGIERVWEFPSKQNAEHFSEKAVKRRKKELEQAKKRIAELDRIFKRIYEDDIAGAISHERFLKLSAEYEA